MSSSLLSGLLKIAGMAVVLMGLCEVATAAPPAAVPEIDAGSLISGLTLLSGGLMVLTGRRRKA